MHKKRTNEQHDKNEERRGPNPEKVEARRASARRVGPGGVGARRVGGHRGGARRGGAQTLKKLGPQELGPKGGAPQRGGSKGGSAEGVPERGIGLHGKGGACGWHRRARAGCTARTKNLADNGVATPRDMRAAPLGDAQMAASERVRVAPPGSIVWTSVGSTARKRHLDECG